MSNMDNYKHMTNEDFDRILEDLVSKMSAREILAIGDVNTILGEELNNAVLDKWSEEHPIDFEETAIAMADSLLGYAYASCDDISMLLCINKDNYPNEFDEIFGDASDEVRGIHFVDIGQAYCLQFGAVESDEFEAAECILVERAIELIKIEIKRPVLDEWQKHVEGTNQG
ncbi:hypothetical protein [Chroococcidiopsis sp.]|uniref:hypothetical protein n=1 Tax=Chroococcidiopsis sp. TaxID=3088168 RepID=UPI003F3146D0